MGVFVLLMGVAHAFEVHRHQTNHSWDQRLYKFLTSSNRSNSCRFSALKNIMKFLVVCGLVAMSSVLAQNTSMPAKECLAKCDQSSALWVTCAAECVGVPHPTNKDVQDTKDCFNQCEKNDGGCQDNCIKTHFVSGDGSQSHQPLGSGSATPTGMLGSATKTAGRAGGTMATGASAATTASSSNRPPSVTPSSGASMTDATLFSVGMLMCGLIWVQK
ncbi:hypothetical protein K493DRAFT_301034 [Basidiobolus meristosporus CBS 931.73]|uniref:Uncharacterized protein n=1 Tax=Basidiobolus meristosporus CBS 931.73 TaxID=1314790 RepID=A0A1Y1YDZ5_9FUNG|nr:hypothetical protein K493DRAFT_301034 [Basidiobolus meristosporus CBS 931.73]|eukprot:ORX96188.1 hypothetical protein K493DRAFT_301034 [Basidiobolus meristosporus CBS 931.73]